MRASIRYQELFWNHIRHWFYLGKLLLDFWSCDILCHLFYSSFPSPKKGDLSKQSHFVLCSSWIICYSVLGLPSVWLWNLESFPTYFSNCKKFHMEEACVDLCVCVCVCVCEENPWKQECLQCCCVSNKILVSQSFQKVISHLPLAY
jgi:hypothetical protein